MHFLRQAIGLAALVILPAGLMAAQAKPAAKKSAPTTAKKRATTRKGATTAKKRAAAPRTTWRTRQVQPTPERYKEIQQALVKKGYLSGEPTGVWNQESMEALRRFQTEQNLEPTGKIDSLSLIALGLGPKHQAANAPPAVAPESPKPAAN